MVPAHAAASSRQARQTRSAAIVPFTGTAVLTANYADSTSPAAARRDLLQSKRTETFAVRDATHWRVEVHTISPVIAIANPVARGSALPLKSSGYSSDRLSGGASIVEGIFRGTASQGFVYVEERIRVLGLPDTLMTGRSHTAGTCAVWTGAFPDGLRWLSMSRGTIAFLVVANKLTTDELVHYAATGICPAPIVSPPSANETENTALDRLDAASQRPPDAEDTGERAR